MIYREFGTESLSLLGMGCMRLPVLDGDDAHIDSKKTAEMIAFALDHGINYFDTAWPYHGGNAERSVGEILVQYPRSSYYLATKFPGHADGSFDKIDEIFSEQLARTKVEYFDFYLLHNVCEADIGAYCAAAPKLGAYLRKMKQEGRIRHVGFSVHGGPDLISRILESYGDLMEFCQIQLNWFDWDYLQTKETVSYLNARNIPIWVMEPVRGGRLSNLPESVEQKRSMLFPGESATQTAFRYLQAIPGVTMILTGASSLEQLQENIAVFSSLHPLTEEECSRLYALGKSIEFGVPCTGCKYCSSVCPAELDIAKIMRVSNDFEFSGNRFTTFMALRGLPEDKLPFSCMGCRTCETVCPQGIQIASSLADFSAKLRMDPHPRNPYRQ
ncbi:MAG TPA: aldo/keto reductase [Methanocorpusculum sp.]|nr:aldo/keto reductase [Methanocorpusculum sp.]